MKITKENQLIINQLKERIETLVNRGKEICPKFQPDESSIFNTITCNKCGYSPDTHLLRDILEYFYNN